METKGRIISQRFFLVRWREDTAGVARVAIKAADAWDSAQRLAAGPQPARERDTDAWWAD